MTITSILIFSIEPDKVEEAINAAKDARKLAMAHGAQDLRMGQIQTGQNTGDWLIASRFANMEAFGKALDGMSQDPEFQALMARNPAQLISRNLVRSVDLD